MPRDNDARREAAQRCEEVVALARAERWTDAIPVAEDALRRMRAIFGDVQKDVGACWQNLGFVQQNAGNAGPAEECYREAVKVRRALLDADGPGPLLQTIRDLSGLLISEGRPADLIPLIREELALYEGLSQPNDQNVARVRTNLAILLLETGGDPAEALRYAADAMPLLRTGQDVEQLHQCLLALARAHRRLYNFEAAKAAYEECARRAGDAFGKDSLRFARALEDFGQMLHETGAFEEALVLLERSARINLESEEATVKDVAGTLSAVARVQFDIGHPEQACELFTRIVSMLEDEFGAHDPSVADALANLGATHHALGDGRSLQTMRRALDIWNAAPADEINWAAYWNCVSSVAVVMNERGSYAEAYVLGQRCLELAKEQKGEAAAASSLAVMASALAGNGDHAGAERNYRAALALIDKEESAFGRAAFDVRSTFAAFLGSIGRTSEALQQIDEARRAFSRVVRAALAAGSERQRLDACTREKRSLDAMLSLVFQTFPGDAQAHGIALHHVLHSKGRAFEAFSALRERLRQRDDPGNASTAQELAALRSQFAAAVLGALPGSSQQVWVLAKKIESLEGTLAPMTPARILEQRLAEVSLPAVFAAIPDGHAMVEYVHFNVFDFPARRWSRDRGGHFAAKYAAFVLRAGAPEHVEAVDLGDAAEINRLLGEYVAAVTAKSAPGAEAPGVSKAGQALRQRVWDPLLGALRKCRRIIIAPDAELARLPFAAFPASDGGHLIDDWTITYLATARDALRLVDQDVTRSTDAVVVADPDFDLRPSLLSRIWSRFATRAPVGSDRPAKTTEASELGRDTGAETKPPVRPRLPRFERLGQTRREGKRVAQLLGVKPWLDRDALKGPLRARSSPAFLHLATHGFFLAPNQPHDPGDDKSKIAVLEQVSAMARSGFVLAGANASLAGRQPNEDAGDGILTAAEVADLDLSGTQMVVLSACDTGLGDVRTGEGVLGLRRAFAMAGARTVVMSLWRVRDEATRELMEQFYTALNKGDRRADALRQAQLDVRRRWPRVRDWAAFICQGDVSTIRYRR
jgi:CHAT domain-containing protein/tetratricopeptide (TPR) repeat protein